MSVSFAAAAVQQHSMPWLGTAAAEPAGSVLSFAADQRIYAEGDAARSYYKVVSGVVRTCRFLSDGRRQIDAFLLPGDVFGFESGTDRRLSAEAVSSCTVIAYRRSTAIPDDHTVGQFFAFAMTYLEQTREHCLLLGRGSAVQKIAAFLIEMAERTDAAATVGLPMSRQDIADYLGLTIETVSRTLSQMERQGTIALPSARKVVLKNRHLLEELNT
ncbi:MAG TPA: helix-turn-helix domain-containing protein [Rhodopila sp.]|uniref:helix-turn-helix domain-containing protein n=1 Tax=Rhodopila sp. TaxID=2480087 RepID=UPI002B707FA4|nr:helix-turn-helix domain-containing protein [Rhodopila sp.]HVY16698.1 helix-turn-helix domain-containing protein [Rhodopila sp.]